MQVPADYLAAETFEVLQPGNSGAELGISYQIGTRDGLPLDLAYFEHGPQVFELVNGKPVFIPGTFTFPNVYIFEYSGDDAGYIYKGDSYDTLVISQAESLPAVPEPSTFLLIATGLVSAGGVQRSRFS